MRGLNGPSEQTGDQFQQRVDQAWVEDLTGGPRHCADPAQHSCAPFSQSWCCGVTHGNERFGRQSLRSQIPRDPDWFK